MNGIQLRSRNVRSSWYGAERAALRMKFVGIRTSLTVGRRKVVEGVLTPLLEVSGVVGAHHTHAAVVRALTPRIIQATRTSFSVGWLIVTLATSVRLRVVRRIVRSCNECLVSLIWITQEAAKVSLGKLLHHSQTSRRCVQLLLRKIYTVFFNVFDCRQSGWVPYGALASVLSESIQDSSAASEKVLLRFLGAKDALGHDTVITFSMFHKLLVQALL